jgi:hypothetical protein
MDTLVEQEFTQDHWPCRESRFASTLNAWVGLIDPGIGLCRATDRTLSAWNTLLGNDSCPEEGFP